MSNTNPWYISDTGEGWQPKFIVYGIIWSMWKSNGHIIFNTLAVSEIYFYLESPADNQ